MSVRIVGGKQLSDPTRQFAEPYGLEEDDAVAVRPDGHIAWRARSPEGSTSAASCDGASVRH